MTFAGSYWRCTSESIRGVPPSLTSAYWDALALKGDDGIPGITIGASGGGASGGAGPPGPQGPQGIQGNPGAPGAAATVTAGTTTTGAPGSSASVTNSGSSAAAILDFTIPRGDPGATGATGAPGAPGAAATIAAGTTTTGAPGSSASVTNSGSSSAAVFDFTIPRGDVGATGATGPQGPSGVIAATAPIQYNSGTQTVSIVPATGSVPGSMSAADKTKLDAATDAATASTLILRDASSRAKVADPSAAQDIATKAYVDNARTPFVANFGDGVALSYSINHALGTRDVIVQVYRNSTPWDTVICDVERTDTTHVNLTGFVTAPTTNQYRVLIVKAA